MRIMLAVLCCAVVARLRVGNGGLPAEVIGIESTDDARCDINCYLGFWR